MKKTIASFTIFLTAVISSAQTTIADFETFTLSPNSAFSNTTSAPFQTTGTSFQYQWSGYWSGGFAYTNIHDSLTAGFTNMYGAKPKLGYNNSTIFVVGQDKGIINLTAPSNTVSGFYITNTTYAYESMQNGDQFAKKFGGITGNDPDFFKVTVRGYKAGVLLQDSVPFYLADFRFANNSLDYIVNTWQWVNTSALGNVDSIQFFMYSSDNGAFGPNTPLFFAMDNFSTTQNPMGIAENFNGLNANIYPNPFNSSLKINLFSFNGNTKAVVSSISGKILHSQHLTEFENTVDLNALPNGIYFLELVSEDEKIIKKIIKN